MCCGRLSSAGAIVQTVITLAQTLEKDLTAEGVETAPQVRLLQELGCDRIQGFFFSAAVPAELVPALLVPGRFAILLDARGMDAA